MAENLDETLKRAVLSGKMIRRLKLRKQRLFVAHGRTVPQALEAALQAATKAHSGFIDELARSQKKTAS